MISSSSLFSRNSRLLKTSDLPPILVLVFVLILVPALAAQPLQAEPPIFERALPGRVLAFPKDHGSHPSFETEWWYFTGQLFDEQKKPFIDSSSLGFQLTFFRRASKPFDSELNSNSARNSGQSFLAHAALSDFARGEFRFSNRVSSGMLGVAGASAYGLRVWNREWKAERMGDSVVLEFSLPPAEGTEGSQRDGKAPGAGPEVRLIAKIVEEPLLHGEQGLSQKGTCEGCASYYYSLPRLELAGHIRRGESISEVHGIGWMDHEFMSNALGSDQVGWDWFSLNTKDGSSVMLFQLRNKSGAVDFASGTLVRRFPGKPNDVVVLAPKDFTLETLGSWQSPTTKGRYPSRWRVRIPKAGLDTEIAPRLADQELVFKEGQGPEIAYWEGAVSNSDNSVLGYVEMTGYSGAMGDIL